MDPSLLEAIGSLFSSSGDDGGGGGSAGLLGALGGGGDPANNPDDIDVGGGWNPAMQHAAVDHAQAFLRLAGMTSANPMMNLPPPGEAASTNRHAPPSYGGGHAGRLAHFGNDYMQFRKQHFGGSFL